MTINENGPKLTAYALGELDDAERAAVEAELAGNPSLRAEVEAIRATATLLEAELAAEAAANCSPSSFATSSATATSAGLSKSR